MSIAYIKRNDTAPPLQSTLTDIDTTGATVTVDLTSAAAIRVIGSRDGVILFDRVATGSDEGVVSMPWQSGDTAHLGPIRIEWEVTWSPGVTQTFPASGYETVWVTRDLDPGTVMDPAQLIAWTLSEAYSATNIVRNGNDVILTADVEWPNGVTGVFTTDTVNNTWDTVDAYHITYTPSAAPAQTVTQPLITRDGTGAVTSQPGLVVT